MRSRPEFEGKLNEYSNWENINWALLLADQPQFAHYCDELNKWDTLGETYFPGDDWAYLLSNQPQFAKKCDEVDGWHYKCDPSEEVEGWEMNGSIWEEYNFERLLEAQPQFAYKLDELNAWKYFSGLEWLPLLKKRPEFADKCDKANGWWYFTDEDWEELLKAQPRLKSYRCSPKD